jgi:hypothetical protein
LAPQLAVRRRFCKLVRYHPVVDGQTGRAPDARLYNLKNDVGEVNNLIEAEPAKAKELQSAWDKWNELNIAPLWGNAVVTKAASDGKENKGKKGGRRAKRAA